MKFSCDDLWVKRLQRKNYRPLSKKKHSRLALSFRRRPALSKPSFTRLQIQKFPYLDTCDKVKFFKGFCSLFILVVNDLPEIFPQDVCDHFLLGSSLVFDLLKSSPVLALSHRFYYTSKQRFRGKLAEDFVLDKYPFLQKGTSKRSRQLPFVISCPDFIEEVEVQGERDFCLVEVKSSSKLAALEEILLGKNMQVQMQVQMSMFAHEVHRAKVILVLVYEGPPDAHEIVGEVVFNQKDLINVVDKQTLIDKYLDCHLFPYFYQEFRFTWTPTQKRSLKAWFAHEIENQKLFVDLEVLKAGFNHLLHIRKHWRCPCFHKYKNHFSSPISLTYL